MEWAICAAAIIALVMIARALINKPKKGGFPASRKTLAKLERRMERNGERSAEKTGYRNGRWLTH